jgi:NAD(P)H-hydrate epimerase
MPSAFVDGNNPSFMNSAWADPILNCAEAKALEARLFGGDEEQEWAAMQCAGAAVARAALDDIEEIGGFPDSGRILVLAGKGHNGGDALLAAKAILDRFPATHADVLFISGERALRPLAVRAWRELLQAAPQRVWPLARIRPTVGAQPCLRPSVAYDICLDGVFGFQFHAPVDAVTAAVLQAVNAHRHIRLRAAVDLPSGVGEQSGDTTFRADFTYATGSVKTPLLEERNRDAAGRLRYCDLGFFAGPVAGVADPGLPAIASAKAGPGSPSPATACDPSVPSRASALPTEPAHLGFFGQVERVVPNALDWVLKPSVLAPLAGLRAPLSDKRTFGHLFVVGGSRSYPGAVLMCARAALRSGAGLVTAFVPQSLVAAYAAAAPEAIWVGWPEAPQGGLALEGLHLLRARLERATAFVIGSGLGSEGESLALVGEIMKLADVPIALDADALHPSVLAAVRGKRVICLPHAGEFRRLAGGRIADLPGGHCGMGILPMSGAPEITGGTRHSPKASSFAKAAEDTTAGRPFAPRPESAGEPGSDVLRAVARETNAVIVLKGPVTRISDGERVYHSFFGGPVLARGGSGDLLAGLVGGLLAQAPGDPLLAACRGVAWHGMAADLLARDRGQVAVQVTQLLDYLPAALRKLAR